ncbi:MAG: hypothetical protein AAF657_32850 [Acidobacteriota bacterium]
MPIALALLAMLLCSPSLFIGRIIDDDFHQLALTGNEQLPESARSPAELFAFIGERWTLPPDGIPWWASEDLHLAFFRPLSGFSHWLDYQLWPDDPRWMHLQSILWLGLTVFAAATLFRRLEAPGALWVGGLSAVLFALDEAHALPTAWLANRNALLSMFFGLLALLAYHRGRSESWRPGAFFAPVCLLLAVLSGEAAVACGAYLLSYALFLDRGALRDRLTALVPCAGTGVIWYAAYKAMGYGTGGSATYIDPGSEPLRFLSAVVERGPVLLWAQFGFPPADLYNFLSQAQAHRAWLAMVAGLALLGLLLVPLLRRDRLARFWTLGLFLSVLPICSIIPSSRLLFYVSLGGAGLLARGLVAAWRHGERTTMWHWATRGLTVPLVLVHLILAPMGVWTTAANWVAMSRFFSKPAASLPNDPAVAMQQVVIVNAPSAFITAYAPVYQAVRGHTIPRFTTTLATSLYAIEVHRPGPRTLRVRPLGGFIAPRGSAPVEQQAQPFRFGYIFQAMDTMYRAPEGFRVGQRIEQPGMVLEVTALTEGDRPLEVTFHFDRPLEAPSWRWLQWENNEFAAWQPPAVGETVTLPAIDW